MARLLSGIVMVVAAVAAIVFLPLLGLRVLACVVAGAAAMEYAGMAGIPRGASRWVLVLMVVAACWSFGMPALVSLPVVMALALAWLAVDVLALGRDVPAAASALAGAAYIGAPLGLLVALHARSGWRVTLLLVGTVAISDSAQYYTGRAFGRRPLAPTISPKKTVEGAVGGLVVAALFMALAGSRVLVGEAVVPLAVLGAVLALVGICGDLFESQLKRLVGLKDSATLIPGHGGVLDRIDALLFVIPTFYLYFKGLP